MGQPKSSLTDPPTDLKEAVDWIMWFGGHGNTNLGYGKHSELANAVDKLVSWSDLKLQLGIQVYISGLIKGLSDRVRDFLGYYSNTQFNNNGIAQHGYQSVYRDLQWSDGGDNLKECAKVFLAVASMVFYGLSFSYLKCQMTHVGGWGTEMLNVVNNSGLGRFMKDMGFDPSRELRDVKGSKVVTILDSEGVHNFEELKTAYGSSISIYSNFIESLVQQQQSNALDYPLTNCHKIATHYFQTQFKNGEPLDTTLTAIKQAFQKFNESCKNYYRDLYDQIDKVLKVSMTLHLSVPASNETDSSSSAGPIAGTLATLGLGGGAAAAYMFNIGGAKTLVNGLLRIG